MKHLLGLVAILLAIQFVPYGTDHSNPAVDTEPAWDRAATRTLAVRACFACHSNETEWPGYARVAPISWLVQRDVDEGRRQLNFSEWQRPQTHADDAPQAVIEHAMPPLLYRLMHSGARLSDAEREELAGGLQRSLVVATGSR